MSVSLKKYYYLPKVVLNWSWSENLCELHNQRHHRRDFRRVKSFNAVWEFLRILLNSMIIDNLIRNYWIDGYIAERFSFPAKERYRNSSTISSIQCSSQAKMISLLCWNTSSNYSMRLQQGIMFVWLIFSLWKSALGYG